MSGVDRGGREGRLLDDPNIQTIAIVRLRVGLGDMLASGPALRALRLHRPDAHIALISWEEIRPIVARMDAYVDELIGFPGYPGIPERRPQLTEIPAFFRSMRRRRFDLALQMYGSLPAANDVTSAIGSRVVGGFYSPGAVEADPSTHLPYPVGAIEIDRHLLLMDFLGASPAGRSMEFPLRHSDIEERDALLSSHGLSPYGYICMHPGATALSRRWPPASFAAVAARLTECGWPIVLIGTDSEREVVTLVRQQACGRVIDLSARTTLGGMASLVASAAAFVGNDSGPAHLAGTFGTPSVVIFLAGDPDRWAASDERRHRALYADVACRPCGLLECPIDFRCAEMLGPDTVAAEVLSVIDSHADVLPLRSKASA
jgi:ADP-heptose:LPS heptosyltransferase